MTKKSIYILVLLTSFLFLYQCNNGNDIRYYLTYHDYNGAFEDEVTEKETKNINFYKVYYQSDKISHFDFFKNNKLFSKHERVYDSDRLFKQKNLDLKGRVLFIEHFSQYGIINKIDRLDSNSQIVQEEFYQSLQSQIPNIDQDRKLLVKTIQYYPEQPNKKKITYYKYLKFQYNHIRRVEDKIEQYEHNKITDKFRFYYDSKANKTKHKHYKNKKLYQIVYYNASGYIEEEHSYNNDKKIILKKFFDRNGNVIKEIKK